MWTVYANSPIDGGAPGPPDMQTYPGTEIKISHLGLRD